MNKDTQTIHIKRVRKKYLKLKSGFDERLKRIWAATEALEIGRGGIQCVAIAADMAEATVRAGIKDLQRPGRKSTEQRIRRAGGGRKPLTHKQPEIVAALDRLIDPNTRGDPESPLRWTSKSTKKLAEELQRQGFKVSAQHVRTMLKRQGYSLQSNKKSLEGATSPNRDAQFNYINEHVKNAIDSGQPVISVDTKKKELIGPYKNQGREWQPSGRPELVNTYDFPDQNLGKAIPYGVYDIAENAGMVNVGINHDTAEFAVESIKKWWNTMGKKKYPKATELTITADSGGSNSSRSRGWIFYLQKFADKTGMKINVHHFPPGTSKWNKIEHRMFSHISQNWRSKPLIDFATVVSLISNTTTRTGLSIKSSLDSRFYPKGVKITDEQFEEILLESAEFEGKWNYTISPRKRKNP